MKKLAWLLVAVLLVSMLGGCSFVPNATPDKEQIDDKQEPVVTKTDVNIVAINGPTGVGMANLWADAEAAKTENNYKITTVTAPDQAVAAIVNGSADIAAVPTVPAGGASLGHVLFAVKRHGSVATVPRLYINFRFVNDTLGITHEEPPLPSRARSA